MSKQQFKFLITAVSDQVSLYPIYEKLRKYGPITQVKPLKDLPADEIPKAAWFVFANTAQTDKLERLDEVRCGSVAVHICWRPTRATKRRRIDHSRTREPIKESSGEKSLIPVFDNMNDHCILNIFVRMSARDLCAIAHTCIRFNSLAQIAFRDIFKRTTLHINKQWTVPECEILFLEFGDYIKCIRLDVDETLTNLLVGFIARFCPNIESIRCCNIEAMAVAIKSYEQLSPAGQQGVVPPFGQLRALEVSFDVLDYRGVISLPSVRIPSLRRLTLRNTNLADRTQTIQFFARNNQLTMLSMVDFSLLDDLHPRDILSHLVNLDELELAGGFWDDFEDMINDRVDSTYFGRLRQLTKLSCRLSQPPIENILAAMHAGNVQLKYLECVNGDEDEYPAIIEQMATIEELRIIDNQLGGLDQVIAVVKKNQHLQLTREKLDERSNIFGSKKISTGAY